MHITIRNLIWSTSNEYFEIFNSYQSQFTSICFCVCSAKPYLKFLQHELKVLTDQNLIKNFTVPISAPSLDIFSQPLLLWTLSDRVALAPWVRISVFHIAMTQKHKWVVKTTYQYTNVICWVNVTLTKRQLSIIILINYLALSSDLNRREMSRSPVT